MDIKQLLKNQGYQNVPLSYDQAYELGCLAISMCNDDADPQTRLQTVTALSVFHNKATYAHRDAPAQIAGICAAVFEEDIGKSPSGFINPDVPYVMDNCGMGGDMIVTANVSTLAGLVGAAAGVNVCKHGSPANADNGRHGSSDFIELLGLNPYMSKELVERLILDHHFAYTEALDTQFKRIHLQTHLYAGIPHMNDLIGPITNPISPQLMTSRVIGVNHLLDPITVAKAYQILNDRGVTNMQNLIAVRGIAHPKTGEGMDELSTSEAGSIVAGLRDGELVAGQRWQAHEFGVETAAIEELSPPQGMSKGDFSLAIMHGEIDGPALDMVLANAALLFMLVYKLSKPVAYKAARDTFNVGRVPALVEKLKIASPLQKAAE